MITTVCGGATLGCTMAVGVSQLVTLRSGVSDDKMQAMATILDFVPQVNIPPFGGCRSPANPNPGAPGMKPCVPVFLAPWSAFMPTLLVADAPVLLSCALLTCGLGGQVFILDPASPVVAMPMPI